MEQYKDCLVYNSTLASIKINYIIYCRNCMDLFYNTFLYLMIFLVSALISEKLLVTFSIFSVVPTSYPSTTQNSTSFLSV